jgi:hypothetical protein
MTGMLSVCAAHTPDGDRQVLTVLPSGAQFLLPPAETLAYAFALLRVARDLFPTKAELDAAVPAAYERSAQLLIDRRVQ